MSNWNGLYIKGHAPETIVWQNWEKDQDKTPVPTDWRWCKWGEVERGSCLYAGYENEEYGDEAEYLYLRFSLKTGNVTGVKRAVEYIENIAEAWNDYDTPKGATRGPNWERYLSRVHLIEDQS